jgi:antitoxin component YwqK of YwqJK toxin-antitoxin module
MLQHISYYRDNKLVLFKNFFENGQCEHNVTFTDSLNCNIEVYFNNGSIKNHIAFFNGSPKKMTEFYPNGLPKCNIEFDLNQNRVTLKRTWFVNAEEQSEIIGTEVKNKFIEKLYYPNGQLKEEGELIYSEDKREYYKNGTWNSYESSGKKKHSEKFKFN